MRKPARYAIWSRTICFSSSVSWRWNPHILWSRMSSGMARWKYCAAFGPSSDRMWSSSPSAHNIPKGSQMENRLKGIGWKGGRSEFNDRNLPCAQMFRRELALVRSAVLSSNRESAAPARQRDCSAVQKHSSYSFQHGSTAFSAGQHSGASNPTGRGTVSSYRLPRPRHPSANTSGRDGFSLQRGIRPTLSGSL